MPMHNAKTSEQFSNAKKKRGHLQIIFEVLELCKQPQSRTGIMQKANLSHSMMMAVLEVLENHKLLEGDGELKKKYVTSAKGREYVQKYQDLQEMASLSKEKWPGKARAAT